MDIPPFALPLAPAIAVAAIFALAGAVKGVVGLGLPTVAIALTGLIMPLPAAAALLLVPALVTNLWQAFAGRHTVQVFAHIWPLLAGIAAGAWLGGAWLGGVSHGWAASALGVALIVYGIVGLAAPPYRVPRGAQPWAAPVAGVLTGMATAVTGVFVLPSVPYLQGLGLGRDALVQALGATFTVATLSLGGVLARGAELSEGQLLASCLALVPALAGMALGQRLRARIAPAVFRRCLFVALILLGVAQLTVSPA